MRLILNGKEREVPPVATVDALIEHLGIHRMVVVEVNGVILPRDRFATAGLAEGDRVEIVHLVGGG
jgi:sulfur carrier protein